MDLSKILAISGKSGLFIMVGETKNGLIVESIIEKKRFPVFASHQVNSLEEISIYTYEKDVPLKDVFKAFFDKLSGEKTISHKSKINDLTAVFEEVLPEYDKDRVNISDIKKVFNWYNLLIEHNILDFTEEENEESKEDNPDKEIEPVDDNDKISKNEK